MQTPDFSAAVPAEMLELSASRQTWYAGRHAASDRTYWVYTPASYRAGTAVPVIMVLHGCAQPFFSHPWAIAYDTHMNQIAEAHQFLVVYPHEFAPPGDVNAISCWNFFLPENQHRDEGEPASLAGIVRDMLKNTSRWTIDPQRIYVAGISSGGGATANLGATYPDLSAAVGVHSGGEYGYPLPFLGERAPARDAMAPLSEAEALAGEVEQIAAIPAGPDPVQQGQKAFHVMGPFARVVPTIVFHGTADHVSDPVNGDQTAEQWITTNHLASHGYFTANLRASQQHHRAPCRAARRTALHRGHLARRPRPQRGHLLQGRRNGARLVRWYPREHLHRSAGTRRQHRHVRVLRCPPETNRAITASPACRSARASPEAATKLAS